MDMWMGLLPQYGRDSTDRDLRCKVKEGKYKGRAPTARAKADKVRELRNAGVRPAEIARQVGNSRASVYRVLG